MKKMVMVSLVFAVVAFMCSDVFAQRCVNNAQESANKARASLAVRSNSSSSSIEWLNQVINVVNMDQPVTKEVSSEKPEE